MPLSQDERVEIQMRLDRSIAQHGPLSPEQLILYKRIWREGFVDGMGFGSTATGRAYEDALHEWADCLKENRDA